jgi:hypothetical protein
MVKRKRKSSASIKRARTELARLLAFQQWALERGIPSAPEAIARIRAAIARADRALAKDGQ